MKTVRLGTRGSPLALWQARAVATAIDLQGMASCEICIVKTSGDQLGKTKINTDGKRLFVKEIEEALINDEIDLAVHSAKDMPGTLPTGLKIGSVLRREDPRDAFVIPKRMPAKDTNFSGLVASLGDSPRIGTGSVRRIAQIKRLWPSAIFLPIRGNLDTRLQKLDAGEYDVLVLAAAGLKRLGLSHRIAATLSVEQCLPAPGQGAIAVEIRESDLLVSSLVTRCLDIRSKTAVSAERALVAGLGGDCQTPIGAFAQFIDEKLELRAAVTSLDGARHITYCQRSHPKDAISLGHEIAKQLLAKGGDKILAEALESRTEAPEKTGGSL